jgi:anti-anti-sigma factor
MAIENWSENTIFIHLPQEPKIADELKAITEIVRERGDCDVVIDFSSVDILTTPGIATLLTLRKLLTDCGRKLVLCSVATAIKGIFTVTGLDGVFEFADDKFAALTRGRLLHHNSN